MSVLSRLNRRERMLVLGVLPVVALFAGYQFGWVPLAQSRADALEQIAKYRTLQVAADTAPLTARDVKVRATPTAPLATRITRSADAADLSLRRLEPEGAWVRVTLDDAAFDDVIAWIAVMEREHSILLRALEMDRRTAPGIVSARLTLESAR